MSNYNNLSDRTQDIMFMLKFVNYAYNQPYHENEAWELGNDERTGGQLIIFHILKELETLDNDLQNFVKNGVCYEK